jgi:hypothetical protein
MWTREDSAERRKYEADKRKPENLTRVETETSTNWLQDVDRIAPLDIQEGRIKRWLKEDTSVRLGEAVADAMLFHLIEWPHRIVWPLNQMEPTTPHCPIASSHNVAVVARTATLQG